MVSWVSTNKLLRGVKRFRLDVLALLSSSPKCDEERMSTQIFAHPNHIVKKNVQHQTVDSREMVHHKVLQTECGRVQDYKEQGLWL